MVCLNLVINNINKKKIYKMADNDLAADAPANLIARTRACGQGLSSLRDDHYSILSRIREEEENDRNGGNQPGSGANAGEDCLEERISAVTSSLEKLEVGVAESNVMLGLSEHFNKLEADRSLTRMEMSRIRDENEWLREELGDTERRLEEALAGLASIQEEKKQWLFMEEVRNKETESSLRPVTPSKIPVGAFRVEEEKAINRALSNSTNGSMDSNRRSTDRAVSPAPSRIPCLGGQATWKSKLPQLSNYRKVMDKQEKAANERQEKEIKSRSKRHRLTLTPATSHSKIPSR